MNSKTQNASSNLDLRSEEIEDILGRPPAWITRRGTVILSAIIISLLAGSWFFRYPDRINSEIVLTSENIPATIVAKTNGRIIRLFVTDKQSVKEGDTLLLLENTANYKDVRTVSMKLDSLKGFIGNFTSPVTCDLSGNFTLGNLQSYFATFRNNYNEYIDFISTDYYTSKAGILEQRIGYYNSVYKKLLVQEDISKETYELGYKQYKRDSGLYSNQVIAENELDKTKSAVLQDRYSWLSSGAGVDNAMIEAGITGQLLLELDREFKDKRRTYEQALSLSYDDLMAQIELWEQTYLLKAPADGLVTFSSFWSENQNVVAGDKLCTVVPETKCDIRARLNLPIAGSGKVKTGQRVNIKFDNYPYMEYGTVKGIVKSVSLVPSDDSYTVEVELPDGLRTSYGKELGYKAEMQGTAEIITEDLRLIERFVMPLRYLAEK